MKHVSLLLGLALACMLFVVSCTESSQPTGEAKKGGEVKEAAVGASTALMAPADSAGRGENDEGVDHYEQGHWDVAEGHFRKGVEADSTLAVAHFNLALALDKLGKHEEATEFFNKAAELAPEDTQITQSEILKAHTGM